jgi:hypothetical protein
MAWRSWLRGCKSQAPRAYARALTPYAAQAGEDLNAGRAGSEVIEYQASSPTTARTHARPPLRECRVCDGVRRDFYVYGLLQREAAAGGS